MRPPRQNLQTPRLLDEQTRLSVFMDMATDVAKVTGCVIGEPQSGDTPLDSIGHDVETGTIRDLEVGFLNCLSSVVSGEVDMVTVAMMRDSEEQVEVFILTIKPASAAEREKILLVLNDLEACLSTLAQKKIYSAALKSLFSRRFLEIKEAFMRHEKIYQDVVCVSMGLDERRLEKEDFGAVKALISLSELVHSPVVDADVKEKVEKLSEEVQGLPSFGRSVTRLFPAAFAATIMPQTYFIVAARRLVDQYLNLWKTQNWGAKRLRITYGAPASASDAESSFEASAAQSSTDVSSPPPSIKETNTPIDIRYLLSPEELNQGTFRLPRLVRETLVLAQSLIGNDFPPPVSDAYLLFGFSVCPSRKKQKTLRYIYHRVLFSKGDKRDNFRAVHRALGDGRLVALMMEKGISRNMLMSIPDLMKFLQTPLERRLTVWRLIQFLRTDSTEPDWHLKRDYGFQRCLRRDEVERMKEVYTQVLNIRSPMSLHQACVGCRILEFIQGSGVQIKKGDKRLFTTTSRTGLGLETQEVPPEFKNPLFKNQG
ncbi:hypothetical protein M011DRAFT_462091 [Sporormia fimetaria CBS 119925]|uniref:Uncharacterized protein n=1 Tax=Sporormia fimetaria CBS 119925 TaxID=1340428 RepID=A0A6A6UXG7_9PLEO|nr:hypothetical protein M011DRAFT_462091 [Sporormia fimetaria CBS 119925]